MIERVTFAKKGFAKAVCWASLSMVLAIPIWWIGEEGNDMVLAQPTQTPKPKPTIYKPNYVCDCGVNGSGEFWMGRNFESPPGTPFMRVSAFFQGSKTVSQEDFYTQFPVNAVVGYSSTEGRWIRPQRIALNLTPTPQKIE